MKADLVFCCSGLAAPTEDGRRIVLGRQVLVAAIKPGNGAAPTGPGAVAGLEEEDGQE